MLQLSSLLPTSEELFNTGKRNETITDGVHSAAAPALLKSKLQDII